jgi:predicted secreted protein
MAEIHGNGGSWTYTDITASVHSWTLSWDGEVHDITDFADGTARTFIGGLTTWTATLESRLDAANVAEPGDSAELTLWVVAASVPKYVGTAIITNMSVTTPVDGIVTASYSLQGTGTLTPTYS